MHVDIASKLSEVPDALDSVFDRLIDKFLPS